ncbi:MAG: ABC transporter substrate-binding protein [Clostridia bacterium]|nr:ABC transporter substrate-binding protein [Clostridia bacterium]
MKEQIYTIPVNDAFSIDCECPLCELERKLENDSISFMLSPALMEEQNRISTNKNGFCRRHFSMLYNKRENVLGVALIIETHMQHQMAEFEKIAAKNKGGLERDLKMGSMKNLAGRVSGSSTPGTKFIDSAIEFHRSLAGRCDVCSRIERIMDRYADVILWMYFRDADFRAKVMNGKGFCLPHYKLLLESAKKYLSPVQRASFVMEMNETMASNLARILDEIQWFAQKFDYRNKDASWKNSKDAVPRAIEKFVSYNDLK